MTYIVPSRHTSPGCVHPGNSQVPPVHTNHSAHSLVVEHVPPSITPVTPSDVDGVGSTGGLLGTSIRILL